MCGTVPLDTRVLHQDDHDYYENDDAYDEIVTFPPDAFMSGMARATQSMYYPEFLPDATRPRGLPGSASGGRGLPISESFGTLRYGTLAEVLLYTVRRTMTMAGPSAVFLEGEVERWLTRRMADAEVTHVVNAPSNPPGWTAGKWVEWYPDVLDAGGCLTVNVAKPYWQAGWLTQHDRLLAAMAGTRGSAVDERRPHAIAIGRIPRAGTRDPSNRGDGADRPSGHGPHRLAVERSRQPDFALFTSVSTNRWCRSSSTASRSPTSRPTASSSASSAGRTRRASRRSTRSSRFTLRG